MGRQGGLCMIVARRQYPREIVALENEDETLGS